MIDKITKPIQDEIPRHMLFAGDIVLVDEKGAGMSSLSYESTYV